MNEYRHGHREEKRGLGSNTDVWGGKDIARNSRELRFFIKRLIWKKKKNPPKSVSFKFYWCSYKNALVVQCTDGAVARDGVQLTVAECLSRIPCLLILPHWLQLMGTANPWWFNQRNDGRLARYFTAIYCKRDGVLLMTPLLLSLPLPCLPLFSWSHFFFFHQQTLPFTLVHKLYSPFFALLSVPLLPPPSLLLSDT